MSEKIAVFTSSDVVKHLRDYFNAPAFCFLEQVADGTGARQHRWADAVAMSVWPSRGYDIHGIEVKVSKYDWKKELQQPEKSAAVQQYCNRWWIATPDESIIAAGELPPTWGWMVIKDKGGMRVVKEAPALTPKSISIEFLASVMRNVQKADNAEIASVTRKAYEEGRESGDRYYREKYVELKKAVDEFHAASGVEIYEWDGGKIGEAVGTLRQIGWRTKQVSEAIKACADIQNMLEQVRSLTALKPAKDEAAA